MIPAAGVGLVMSLLLEWVLLCWKRRRMGQALGSFACAVSAGAARPECDRYQQLNCSSTGWGQKNKPASIKAMAGPGECNKMV